MEFKIYIIGDDQDIHRVISDIHNLNLKKILVWLPTEYHLPSDGKFNDSGKTFSLLLNLIKEKLIEFYILVASPINQKIYSDLKNQNLHFLEWPTALLHLTKFYMTNSVSTNMGIYGDIDVQDIKQKQEYDKLYVCLNNNPHPHRIKLIDELYKNNLFDYGKISWLQADSRSKEKEFKFWKEKKITLDHGGTSNWVYDSKCLINLVPETVSNHLFFTEKTFKPIIFEQIFLCFGSDGQNLKLKDYGFELYDEIFDYNFDLDENIETRIDGVIKNLIKLKNSNFVDIYLQVQDKIKYNKKNSIYILENDPYISKEIKHLYENYRDVFHEFYKMTGHYMMYYFIKLMDK
jgi:hypothetical protein